MSYVPQFVKPSRRSPDSPSLTRRVTTNVLQGKETTLVLDLNVLSAMRKVASQELSLAEAGLTNFVAFLRTHPVALAPGYALREAAKEHTGSLIQGYERFLSIHCPSYNFIPTSSHNYSSSGDSRDFQELDLAEKSTLLGPYIAMLVVQVIDKEFQTASPERKFKAFVDYMAMEVNLLSGIETEVAMYWFYSRGDLDDEGSEGEFKRRCKAIRDNFHKGGRGVKRLRRTLNYARDLWYLRVTDFQDGKLLDGVIQDTWFVTADRPLVELAKSVYFYPRDSESAKHFALSRGPIQESNPYWRYCDRVFRGITKKRSRSLDQGRIATKDEIETVLSKVEPLQNKLILYWPDVE